MAVPGSTGAAVAVPGSTAAVAVEVPGSTGAVAVEVPGSTAAVEVPNMQSDGNLECNQYMEWYIQMKK